MDRLLECLRGTAGIKDSGSRSRRRGILESRRNLLEDSRFDKDAIDLETADLDLDDNEEISLDDEDEVAVIDTDLKDGDDVSPNDYIGKKVVVCPICLKPLFSDNDNCDIYCPVCDKDVEVGDAVGVVSLPTEEGDVDPELGDTLDPTEFEDDEVVGEIDDESDEDDESSDDDLDEACGNGKKKIAKKTESVKKRVKTEAESGNPEPTYKVGDIVRPERDLSAGYTDDNRMDMKFRITKIGPFDKLNGYKYVAEPITDAAKDDVKRAQATDEYEGDNVEFYGLEVGKKYDETSGFELVESMKTESDKPASISIEDCQKWIDYDMETYGYISKETEDIIHKAGFQVIKDDHGDYEVAAKSYESMDDKKTEASDTCTGILGAKVGDKIIDNKTGREGIIKKSGQSGNYDIVYADFGNGLRRIDPMDDAQRECRYQFADKNDPSKYTPDEWESVKTESDKPATESVKTESLKTVSDFFDERCSVDEVSKMSCLNLFHKIKEVEKPEDAEVEVDVSDTKKILRKDGKRYIQDDKDYYEVDETKSEKLVNECDSGSKKVEECVEVKVCPEGSVTVTSSEANTEVHVDPQNQPEEDSEIDDFDTDTFDTEVTQIVDDVYEDDDLKYESKKIYQKGKCLVVEGLISNSHKNTRRVRFTCENLSEGKFKVEGLKDYKGYVTVVGKANGKSYKVESVNSNIVSK